MIVRVRVVLKRTVVGAINTSSQNYAHHDMLKIITDSFANGNAWEVLEESETQSNCQDSDVGYC